MFSETPSAELWRFRSETLDLAVGTAASAIIVILLVCCAACLGTMAITKTAIILEIFPTKVRHSGSSICHDAAYATFGKAGLFESRKPRHDVLFPALPETRKLLLLCGAELHPGDRVSHGEIDTGPDSR